MARSTVAYRSRRPPQQPLRDRLRELARNRVSYGSRRLHVLLRREGWGVNVKRVHPLYRDERLRLARLWPRRRKSGAARLAARHRFGGEDVAAVLGAAARGRGAPPVIQAD